MQNFFVGLYTELMTRHKQMPDTVQHDDLIVLIPQDVRVQNPLDVSSIVMQSEWQSINNIHIILEPYTQARIHDNFFESGKQKKYIYAYDYATVDVYFSIQKQYNIDQTYYLYAHGKHSSISLYGYYVLHNDQRCIITTKQYHTSPQTQSKVIVKGILYDNSKAHYRGLINIAPHAYGTCAAQTNKHLLLSAGAQAISEPSLEILNNDVQCTHGSALSYIDQEQLFYLQSRGMSQEQAQQLLLDSFLFDVDIHKIKW